MRQIRTKESLDKNLRYIAEAVAAEGGRAYFVGGCVRDKFLGRENKDIDILFIPAGIDTKLLTMGTNLQYKTDLQPLFLNHSLAFLISSFLNSLSNFSLQK